MRLRRERPVPGLPEPPDRWVSQRQVRRFCRDVVRAIGLRPPLDVATLCTEVGRLRGRPIHLVHQDMPSDMFGFSMRSPSGQPQDFVFVAANTTRLHREHIVLHELGHVLAGHLDDDAASTLGHDPDAPGGREWVAESIATTLRERAMVHEQLYPDAAQDPASRALDEALRGGRPWL